MKKVKIYVLFVLLTLTLTNTAGASIFDYDAEEILTDTTYIARFRIYVPDSVQVIRGVFFRVRPKGRDSRNIVTDQNFIDLCESIDFALLGAKLSADTTSMDSTGFGEAIITALDTFAIMSEHPELKHSCMFLEGYSWGGQFSYHFSRWAPERAIGFVTMKGGYHDTAFAGDAIYVPGYMFIGENDYNYRIENLTGIFEEHRPLGARWILAMQPDASHSEITDRDLLDNYFLTITEKRLPAEINPDEPVELQLIDEYPAWLGQRDTGLIGNLDCFVYYDPHPDSASWFATQTIGEKWQNFVTDGAVEDTIPCRNKMEILETIQIEDEERTYILQLPDSIPDTNLSLVINLHDDGNTNEEHQNLIQVDSTAFYKNFITAYPQAQEPEMVWHPETDIYFISDMIDAICDDYQVDRSRVYATGFSQGANFTHYLANRLNNKIAATCAVSGIIEEGWDLTTPPIGVPVMMLHNLYDNVYPLSQAEETCNLWIEWDETVTEPNVEQYHSNPSVWQYHYPEGRDESEVHFYRFTYFDSECDSHLWPTKEECGISPVDVFWPFFQEHSLGDVKITEQNFATTPDKISLFQNYPNPFNPTTTIQFSLQEKSDFSIKIYDVSGKLVKNLVEEIREAGYYTITWDGTDEAGTKMGSGIYLYSVTSGDYMQTKKCLLLK